MAGAPGWSRDEVAAYLALAQVPGIGAARLHTLVAAFETAAAAVHAPHGAEAARQLAAGLASAGVVVVSGMARGIDAIAHTAALDAGGSSVGILANGFGVIYPAANRALYERMVARGCLITELPPGERP